MAGTGRLSVYDSSDKAMTGIGKGRDADAHIGADSVASLRAGLDQLVANKQQFKRVVFDTHGGEGRIRLGGDRIWASTWRTELTGKGYESLFPFFSKSYFGGCSISDTEDGWSFLEAANDALFSSIGGVSMAYTSAGYTTIWGNITMKHLWGELRMVIALPGKKQRRVAGGDLVQKMMWGKIDRELAWVLKEADIF